MKTLLPTKCGKAVRRVLAYGIVILGPMLAGTAFANGTKPVHARAKKAAQLSPPTLNYTTPQTLYLSVAATLTPTTAGAAALGYSSALTAKATGFTTPRGVATDAAGDIYVADYGANTVWKIAAGGNTKTAVGSGFSQPTGVAVDAAGNVYVADYGNTQVKKIPGGTGTPIVIGNGYNKPYGIACDAAGNVFIADYLNNAIKEVKVSDGSTVSIGNTFSNPAGVAVDAAGNIYVADFGTNSIKKMAANGTNLVQLSGGFNQPYAVTVDPAGNVFVADEGNHALKEIPVGTNGNITINNTFTTLNGVAVDNYGDIITADYASATLNMVLPVGGFYINAPLPAGLSFNQNTGVISGTPTALSAATDYLVSAYNGVNATSATLNITVTTYPIPTISYQTPQNLVINTSVSPIITPTSTGVAAPGYRSGLSTVATGFGLPSGVATDSQGNIYIADQINSTVWKITHAGVKTQVGSGFANPVGVAVDSAGNVYVDDYNNAQIKKVPKGTGTPVVIGSGFNHPYGIACDAAGDVFLADFLETSIKEIKVKDGTIAAIGSGLTNPAGVAVDSLGNVYVADYNAGNVKKIPAGSNTPIVIGSGFAGPYGVAVDPQGDVFVADQNHGALKEIYAGGNVTGTLITGFGTINAVAVDAYGNLVTTDNNNTSVMELQPVGGYYISRNLPKGLAFDQNTGVISGTPTALSAASNYIITAYNIGGPASANVSVAVNPYPLPAISYVSPQTYTAGTAITALSPVASAVSAPSYSVPINVQGGFNVPAAVALDKSGNIYVADYYNSAVVKITPTGSSNIGSGFNRPAGVAVDAAGNVYVADRGNGAVYKIPAAGGSTITLSTGLPTPGAIALDAQGYIYVVDISNNDLYRIPPGGGTAVTIYHNLNNPTAVAVDPSGNIYIAGGTSGTIYKIGAGGGNASPYISGFTYAKALGVDAAGNLYVVDSSANTVSEVPAGGGSANVLLTGLVTPDGVAIDGAGNLYVVEQGTDAVRTSAPSGGYFINQPLPAGLSFDYNTGTISGTPLQASSSANYVIAAYNAHGGTSATLNITVNAPSIPAVSYASPQNYVLNAVIPSLAPASSGGPVAPMAYNNAPTLLAAGFNSPSGAAADSFGNIYVADYGNHVIKKIPAGGGTPTVFATGFVNPSGVATDAAGNVYVADGTMSVIKKIPAGGGTAVNNGSGLTNPTAVALDPAGNVYVIEKSAGAVVEIPAGGGSTVIRGTGFTLPTALAVDASGNIFVADENDGSINKIPAAGGTPFIITTAVNDPLGLAVDASGNIFAANRNGNSIAVVPANGGPIFTIGRYVYSPIGIAVDGSNNVYVTEQIANDAKKIAPVGGYFISPFLPAGLSFDNNTGILSGTPAVATPPTVYTVSVYNAGGTSQTAFAATVNATPPPAISYTTPVKFTKGVAVSPLLKPANSGGQAALPGYAGTSGSLASGFNFPRGITVDAAGNIYVSNGDATIKKIPAGGGAATTYASGFGLPFGLACNAAGDVFVADETNNIIKKIPAGGGTPVQVGPTFNSPTGVAVDAAGNLFVASVGDNTITEIPAGGGTPVTLGSGFNGPSGVAVDAIGNVYVADGANNVIKKIPAGGGSPVTIATGFNDPVNLAVDPEGDIFVADINNAVVKEIPGGGGSSPLNIGGTFSHPIGVAFDGHGAVYEVDYYGGYVTRILPTGGFFIDKALPAGLSFDSVTGTISGTPTVVSLAQNYTVTAYNSFSGGGGSTALNIQVVQADATLTKLTLSSGGLSPAFGSTVTSYATAVGNSVTSLTLTPTATDPNATIKVNGTTVASGSASGAIALNVGVNTITTVVTAPDGITSKTYTVTVTRAPSTNDNLSSLKMSKGIFSPTFASATTSYTDAVGNTITSVTVTPTTTDANATVKVNGTAVASGAASGAINLNVGNNTISIVVTAQDGTTTKTYTVTVTRAGNNNDNLASLKMSKGTFSPAFDGAITSYTDAVGNTITSVTVTPTTSDPDATIQVNGTAVASGTASGAINLAVGANIINVVVTASDNVTTKTYTVTVNRAGNNNDNLTSLKMSKGTFSPTFAGGTTSYTDAVGNTITSVTITPTASDPGAAIQVNGATVASGTASAAINLAVGANTINVVVTASDNVTTKTYTVMVTRAGNNNDNLASLKMSKGTFSPAFDGAITSYTDAVGNTITSVTVTPTISDPDATVKVNGTTVASGAASGAINLNVGNNTINVVVTASDNVTTKTYTITVTRAGNNNDNLSSLKMSKGTFSPTFASATTSYTDAVGNTITSVTVTPTTSDPDATIKVNGTAVASGTASAAINLAVGANTINVVVTASDNVTTKTYTVTVNRASGGADSFDPGISVTKPAETPALAEDGIQVHQGVSPNGDGINDFLTIDNISQYPDNKLTIMNRNGQLIYEAKGYDNATKAFDGHSSKNGQMQLPGTYFYQLEYVVNGIVKRKTGFVVLKY